MTTRAAPASVRCHVQPRDVPPAAAARVLGLTEARFLELLPNLHRRGFPFPDETTGNFDLAAITAWQDRRSGLLGDALTPEGAALHAPGLAGQRLRTRREQWRRSRSPTTS
jgi:hypothetical protein